MTAPATAAPGLDPTAALIDLEQCCPGRPSATIRPPPGPQVHDYAARGEMMRVMIQPGVHDHACVNRDDRPHLLNDRQVRIVRGPRRGSLSLRPGEQ
jgi:hypothetical protein